MDGTCPGQCPGHVQDIEIFLGHCPVPALLGVTGLELIGVSTGGVTSLDAKGEVSNKSIISDVLVFDDRDGELALLRACPDCGSIK